MTLHSAMRNDRLSPPDGAAAAHGRKVARSLERLLEAHGGFIDFARYMRHVLYAPGLGYYSAGSEKLGGDGDYVTAPLISPLFSRALGRYILSRSADRASGVGVNILELGAGTGVMAADILTFLRENRALPKSYLILEPSADLERRQKTYLARRIPRLLDHIAWLNALPADGDFNGLIIANEVIDALPVQRFVCVDGRVRRLGVGLEAGRLCWKTAAFAPGFHAAVAPRLPAPVAAYPNGYRAEVNLLLGDWVTALAGSLGRGEILLLDYGYERSRYYAPERSDGTVRAHYRHHAVDDALLYPGLADVTAWVDFTALAQAAETARLTVTGYTSQADFLVQYGILDLLQAEWRQRGDEADYLATAAAVKRLIEPGEMGETVKVICLGKDESCGPVFERDRRYRL